MKVLLTGATGLVGKELGKKLVMSGHHLVVLSRNPEKAKLELPFPAEIYKWDGLTDIPPEESFNGVEAVIHLAGESIASSRWTARQKMKIFDSRILGTRSLVRAIEISGKVKTFISASAIGIYGDCGEEILNETHAHGSDFLSTVCYGWEKETEKITKEVRVINLRIGVVLSRQGGALEKLIPLFSMGLGGVIGNGKQWMSWIHLEDLVRLCQFGLEEPSMRGPYNAVSPHPVTNKVFSKTLANSLGRSLFFPVPSFVMKVAMGDMSTIVLSSQHVDSQKLNTVGFKFTYPDLALALNEICQPLRGGQKELFAEQWVPHTPEKIFPFFCDEKNLEKLTPEFLSFKVLKKSTDKIQQGTIIEYRLKLHGIPMHWKSMIDKWDAGSSFVDHQLTGPYKRWHHTHEFIPLANGTLMRDRVSYSLPLGRLGDVVSGWKVLKDVRKIFAYRRSVIRKLFGA